MPQMMDKRRKALVWAGAGIAVVLGAFAIAAPIARSHDADRAVISTQYGDFTAAPSTMEAMKWLSERGRTNGFRFNANLEVTDFRIALEAADGVELPSGEFAAEFIRLNEQGQVVHVEFAAASAPGCTTVWVQDSTNPRYWFATCTGTCAPQSLPCSLLFDIATLELSCGSAS